MNFFCDQVFPSSFSIKASLGNLKISDDSLLTSHIYFWACDMRNPGGSSFVEVWLCIIISYLLYKVFSIQQFMWLVCRVYGG